MTTEDRLRLHLAGKQVTWRTEATATVATWDEDGAPCALACLPQPLTAASVLDAYLSLRPARLTLVCEGDPSPVARRSAARFGVTLLDAASLPELPPAAAPPVAPPPAPVPAPTPLPAPEPLVATPEVAPPAAVLPPAPVPVLVEDGPALPWDPSVPPVEPSITIEVTAGELLALPWHQNASVEETVEIVATPRKPRGGMRPTMMVPDGGSWGLPWPRPVASTEALSRADPRIWSSQERVHAMREELDASVGAASFGAVKPEGSPWLRRMQTGP